MNRLLIVSLLCLILFSCKDEPLDSMNEINDKWASTNDELKQAEAEIDAIMAKYNAKSFEITIENEGAKDISEMLVLFDQDRRKITPIAKEDVKNFFTAHFKTQKKEVEMSQLSDVDEVFTVVETPPSPQGGMESLYKYIASDMKYPEQAKKNGVEGKVFVQFIINEFGEVSDVEVIKGIGAGCDAEAARVVKNMGQWEPGKQRGEAVKVRMVLPITFKLS